MRRKELDPLSAPDEYFLTRYNEAAFVYGDNFTGTLGQAVQIERLARRGSEHPIEDDAPATRAARFARGLAAAGSLRPEDVYLLEIDKQG